MRGKAPRAFPDIPLCAIAYDASNVERAMSKRTPKLTYPLLQIISVVFTATKPLSGVEIHEATGLPSGTLYPLLARLSREGWFRGAWEDADPHALGRPRRRSYVMTVKGTRMTEAALARNAIAIAATAAAVARAVAVKQAASASRSVSAR